MNDTNKIYKVKFLKDVEVINLFKLNISNFSTNLEKLAELQNAKGDILAGTTLVSNDFDKNTNLIKFNWADNKDKLLGDLCINLNEVPSDSISIIETVNSFHYENCYCYCVDTTVTPGKEDEKLEKDTIYKLTNIKLARDGKGRTANVSGMKYRYRLKRFRVLDLNGLLVPSTNDLTSKIENKTSGACSDGTAKMAKGDSGCSQNSKLLKSKYVIVYYPEFKQGLYRDGILLAEGDINSNPIINHLKKIESIDNFSYLKMSKLDFASILTSGGDYFKKLSDFKYDFTYNPIDDFDNLKKEKAKSSAKAGLSFFENIINYANGNLNLSDKLKVGKNIHEVFDKLIKSKNPKTPLEEYILDLVKKHKL